MILKILFEEVSSEKETGNLGGFDDCGGRICLRLRFRAVAVAAAADRLY
ncbi:MAG: hypothetical protein LBB22_01515 [Treponema sp.]|jgi:hypothetical protein|nr:hypothetical protein [Treponema sp.]